MKNKVLGSQFYNCHIKQNFKNMLQGTTTNIFQSISLYGNNSN